MESGILTATSQERAIEWLLASDEPAVRFLARRDLLGEHSPEDQELILEGARVRALLVDRDGHPYNKWGGAHWRLVSLVELAVPPTEPRVLAAVEDVLAWLASPDRARRRRIVDGLVRACASMEGNALAACVRLGLADDARVEQLARLLAQWQWPDGGWNCDVKASGRTSSLNESLPAMWGLHEYASATQAPWARDAADRAAEMFLRRRLFRSSTGEVLREAWLHPRYPPYWHYDILQGLLILARMGKATDPRTEDAYDALLRRRLPDGRWRPRGSWWKLGDGKGNTEVVDWGRSGPNEMLTLNALRVLRAHTR